ncbi:hypothetical protein SAMN05216371_3480 [Streptomyces sp. TLI_053]|nr:hypothetical protein SAMN05216371_3480 [Streptomyces sp. TLI_053]
MIEAPSVPMGGRFCRIDPTEPMGRIDLCGR